MKKYFNTVFFLLICLSVAAQPGGCPMPVISASYNCGDDSTQLITPSGFDTYSWSPGYGLSDSTVQNPMVLLNAGMTYTLTTTLLGADLIVNPDFSAGNTGFISGQFYSPVYSPCNYYVGSYFFATSYYLPDHTPTADNFYMAIDGCSPATILWEQTIPVIESFADYDFSFWASRADQIQPIFEIHFIGNVTGDNIVATQNGIPYTGTWTWDDYGFSSWNSGANTSVTIRIVNLETDGYGNDFGLDDFSFRKYCTDTASITLSESLFQADFDYTIGCVGTPSVFTESDSATVDWFWDFGDGSTSVSQSPQHVFAAPGTYSVALAATTGTGCQDTVTTSVLVPDVPSANFSFLNDCYYNAAAFTDLSTISSGSISQWEWNFGDGSTDSVQHSSHQYLTSGTYTVQLVVTSDANCKDTLTQLINRFEAPVANFSSITGGCEHVCIPFTDLSVFVNSPIVSWQWDFDNGQILNTPDPVPCFTNSSTTVSLFDVSLTVVNDLGCQNTFSVADYLQIFPKPVAAFNYDSDMSGGINGVVQFTNASHFADSYTWSFGDETDSTHVTDPLHVYGEAAGSYQVTLVASSFGGVCVDTTQAVVIIPEELLFYVPNCFTPDGDAFNQTFQPVFTSGIDPYNFHLVLYNRWGEIIFESYNAAVGWSGTYGDSGLVEDGVYVWEIHFKEPDSDRRHRYTGHVTVLK